MNIKDWKSIAKWFKEGNEINSKATADAFDKVMKNIPAKGKAGLAKAMVSKITKKCKKWKSEKLSFTFKLFNYLSVFNSRNLNIYKFWNYNILEIYNFNKLLIIN